MKSEKGMTFISTVILVFIIALIAFGVVYFARMETTKEKAEDIKVDMLSVQAKVKNISSGYLVDKKKENLVGTKLSEMKEDENIKEFLDKNLFNSEEKGKLYYVLNQENLNELELNQIILEDGAYYIAEYSTGDLYYTQGYIDENGETHYKAKEIEEAVKEKNTENNEEKNAEESKNEIIENKEKVENDKK